MSHRMFAAWPLQTIEGLTQESTLDEAYFYQNGGSAPQPGQIQALKEFLAASPQGIPIPDSWSSVSVPTEGTIHLCWSVTGAVYVEHSRVVRVGEAGTPDAGGIWGERRSACLESADSFSDFVQRFHAVSPRPWRHETDAEKKIREARWAKSQRILTLIQGWAQLSSACTIPWDGVTGRRDIADCIQAIAECPLDRRCPEWQAVVKEAIEMYPVARPGILSLLRDLDITL